MTPFKISDTPPTPFHAHPIAISMVIGCIRTIYKDSLVPNSRVVGSRKRCFPAAITVERSPFVVPQGCRLRPRRVPHNTPGAPGCGRNNSANRDLPPASSIPRASDRTTYTSTRTVPPRAGRGKEERDTGHPLAGSGVEARRWPDH